MKFRPRFLEPVMSWIFSRHLVLDKKKDGKICVIFWYKEGTLNVIQHNSNKYLSPATPKISNSAKDSISSPAQVQILSLASELLTLKGPPFAPLPDPLPPQAADSMTNTFLSLFKNVL